MTYQERITEAIRIEVDSPDGFNKDRLNQNLAKILADQASGIAVLTQQFHRLVGDESAMTIPLSDGCVAKVKFSKEVTRKHLEAFATIFQNIAENYVVEADTDGPPAPAPPEGAK